MKCGSAARESEDAAGARRGSELRFERVDVRSKGGDPVRLDGITQQVELVAGEVGWGEEQTGHGASQLRLRQ